MNCDTWDVERRRKLEALVRGDIVKNNYAGEGNPYRYLAYLRKGEIWQGRYSSKSYDCLGHDGKIVQFFRDDAQLEKVGHMDELDAFMDALRGLKSMGKELESDG